MSDVRNASTTVTTQVGSLHVESIGAGPPAVLWHSLFVDSRSWHRVVEDLAHDRRLVLITGPGHGPSGDPGRHYSMEDCADAASSVLDALKIKEPVDWVGNAWGGHVGIVLAARQPQRFRTLTTVGTPVHSYTLKGRVPGPARALSALRPHAISSGQHHRSSSLRENPLPGPRRGRPRAGLLRQRRPGRST